MTWAKALAKTLAKIHSIEIKPEENKYLMNANVEAAWFLRYEKVPKFMKSHPMGEIVWEEVNAKYPYIEEIEPKLSILIIGWEMFYGKKTKSQVLLTGKKPHMEIRLLMLLI